MTYPDQALSRHNGALPVIIPPAVTPALLLPHEQAYVTETATGLDFRRDTPIEIWAALIERLIRAHKRLEFALADAINFGRQFGERYAQWVHETGLSDQTLHDIAWVGRQVEPSRRREDISFAIHREVASLPPTIQDTVLDLAVSNGWKRDQVRRAAGEARAHIRAAERALLPVPQVTARCEIVVGDARQLPLPDATVHLNVTSPPYALRKRYLGGDIDVDDWRTFMLDWLREAYRVAVPGGRLALNVPLDTSAVPADPEAGQDYVPARPTYGQALFAAQRAGWLYRTTIVWSDDQLGKSVARGSVDSASSPHIYFPGEMILVMFKANAGEDAWGRPDPGRTSDLDHLDWLAWTNGDWRFPGESNPHEDHPAAFPIELPRRLIHLLSFPGDLVLDQFVGSGTTAEAAVAAGRDFYGVDSQPTYVAASLRRVAQRTYQPDGGH